MNTTKETLNSLEGAKEIRLSPAEEILSLKAFLGMTIDSDCRAIRVASDYAAVIGRAISESTTTPVVPNEIYKEATREILTLAANQSWDSLMDNHGDLEGTLSLHPYAKRVLRNQLVKLDYAKPQKVLAILVYIQGSKHLDDMVFTAFDLESAMEILGR